MSEDQESTLEFIAKVFGDLAQHFLLPNQQGFRFMIRGGLSFGSVVHGKNAVGGSAVLNAAEEYRRRVLIGSPLAEAYDVERQAPPFGMAISLTARRFAPQGKFPLVGPFLEWWRVNGATNWHEQQARTLKPILLSEIDELSERSYFSGYSKETAMKHKALADQYLPN